MKGRLFYAPKEFTGLIEEYKKKNKRTSDALREIVYDAKIGREFNMLRMNRGRLFP
jgi:hypothetical protein